MKIELELIDVCTPDYFNGCKAAHIQVAVWHKMKMTELRDQLRTEVRQGCIHGCDRAARLLSSDMVHDHEEKEADQLTRRVYAAINRLQPAKKGARTLFSDLEPETEDYDGVSVYAYFLISFVG